MLKIISTRLIGDYDEAANVALHEVGKDDMSLDIARLFYRVPNRDKFRIEGEKNINAKVRDRYGNKAKWSGNYWFIPLPHPSYESSPIPRINFVVQAYLVASLRINVPNYTSSSAVMGGLLDRLERLFLPMSFLQAMLDDDLDHFGIASKDGEHTGWMVPGFKETVYLANDFVNRLSELLRQKSVAAWLLDFGAEGMAVAPLVIGSLLGLQMHEVVAPVPAEQQSYSKEIVIDRLTHLYGSARTAELFEKIAPFIKSSMTNQEVIHMIIKEAGVIKKWEI